MLGQCRCGHPGRHGLGEVAPAAPPPDDVETSLVLVGIFIIFAIVTSPIATYADKAAKQNRFREKFIRNSPDRGWDD